MTDPPAKSAAETMGRGGALVESIPFNWRVVSSNPALSRHVET